MFLSICFINNVSIYYIERFYCSLILYILHVFYCPLPAFMKIHEVLIM